MSRIKKWKSNVKKNRADVSKLNKMGKVIWEGGISSMPKTLKQKGKKYKSVKVHDIFGKTNYVTVELKK